MKKRYNWNDSVQLTKNINVRELRNPVKATTVIELDHVNKIQSFMNTYGYDKVIFSSGYRTSNYNRKIGGSSNSEHCKGNATDQCFYKKGKVVPAKEVCCNAQDFGFKGIGYITTNYVHLDSRTSGMYRGDERNGYSNNVGGDFYKYFGIKKASKTYSGVFPTLPKRGYFKKGDTGIEVKHLQMFLNWANGSKLSVDGILGNNTLTQVGIFQSKVGLKQDKLFGKNCLAKAKSYNK